GVRRVMVDCGLFQGVKDWRLRNRQPLPLDPADLDAVILTHAHLDHTGYLPVLVRDGFRGPVFCTGATADLASIILLDSARLQEEDAAHANRHGYSRHHPALPLYTQADAEQALTQLRTVTFGESVDLGGRIRAVLHGAGHILGAATVRVADDGTSLLFSGDLGRASDPLMLPPALPPAADHVVVESTYGNRRHAEGDAAEALAQAVRRTAARGGTMVIPAFAVARAQAILFELHGLARAGRIPDLPVFLDSPMASRATEVFLRHAHALRVSGPAFREALAEVEIVESVRDSKRIDHMPYPRIIVSASGMATAGRVLHHLKALAPDPRNTILLAGFQAAGTRGADLAAGVGEVKIHGAYVPVRAEVVHLDAFSSHADHEEILGWLAGLPAPPRQVFVTHGEPAAADALRRRIEERFGWACRVPAYGERADLAAPGAPSPSAGPVSAAALAGV
ncbi:MAG TPA: MBL fold metallo-hydrolase, partial [Longimicrobium sp.]